MQQAVLRVQPDICLPYVPVDGNRCFEKEAQLLHSPVQWANIAAEDLVTHVPLNQDGGEKTSISIYLEPVIGVRVLVVSSSTGRFFVRTDRLLLLLLLLLLFVNRKVPTRFVRIPADGFVNGPAGDASSAAKWLPIDHPLRDITSMASCRRSNKEWKKLLNRKKGAYLS